MLYYFPSLMAYPMYCLLHATFTDSCIDLLDNLYQSFEDFVVVRTLRILLVELRRTRINCMYNNGQPSTS